MSSTVILHAAGAEFPAYVASPLGAPGAFRGAVVVIHEVWGLGDHIRAVAERYAAEGFVAIAPDLMGGQGVPADLAWQLQRRLMGDDSPERAAAQLQLRDLMAPIAGPDFATSVLQKLVACIDHLSDRTDGAADIGVIGFGFGGSYAYSLALADQRVRALVPYYGYTAFTTELLGEIPCPVLAFVGHDDEALFQALPALNRQMKDAGVDFTAVVYRDAGHAFFNDENPASYRRDAAEDSFTKSVDFLTEHLS